MGTSEDAHQSGVSWSSLSDAMERYLTRFVRFQRLMERFAALNHPLRDEMTEGWLEYIEALTVTLTLLFASASGANWRDAALMELASGAVRLPVPEYLRELARNGTANFALVQEGVIMTDSEGGVLTVFPYLISQPPAQ